jgi:hypothetical protein
MQRLLALFLSPRVQALLAQPRNAAAVILGLPLLLLVALTALAWALSGSFLLALAVPAVALVLLVGLVLFVRRKVQAAMGGNMEEMQQMMNMFGPTANGNGTPEENLAAFLAQFEDEEDEDRATPVA